MGISATTLSIGKGYTNLVALGLSDVTVDGTTITFTLNDGETASVTLPTPKDGKDGKDGTNGTNGVDGAKGDKGDKGEKGDKGDKGDAGEVAIEFTVVDELPTSGTNGVMYLVPKATESEQDIYDEYMWIGSAWEHIGSTEVELSDYYTKDEADEKFAEKGQGGSGEVYSTDETVIGTWIDGKPLYRRVFEIGATSGTKVVPIDNISEIDWVTSIRGIQCYDANDDEMCTIPFSHPTGNYVIDARVIKSSSGLKIICNNNSFNHATIIIEYTKTTD